MPGSSSHAANPSHSRQQTNNFPFLHAKYIAIHAACATISRMSGASEFYDNVLRDMESINVLAKDGGSASLLEAAIRLLAVREFSASSPRTAE
jgi:hypothetical protein